MDSVKEIQEIIEMTNAIIQRKIDPFKIDVKSLIEKLDSLFPKLRKIEELLLDVEALERISNVLGIQTKELNYMSSKFYLSSEDIINKLKQMNIVELSNMLSLTFHPVLSTNFINEETLLNAYEYWLSIKKRIRVEEEKSFSLLEIKKEDLKLREKKIAEKLAELENYLENNTPIELNSLTDKMERNSKVEFLYLLSYLISSGKFSIEDKGEEMIIRKGKAKESSSLVFTIKP